MRRGWIEGERSFALRSRSVITLILALAILPLLHGPAAAASTPQFRAYWVDAFGEGIWTPAEVDKLIAQSKAANINALVVQVGRRGDCFCNNAIMPRTQQTGVAPRPYDPLQYLIDKAHPEGIQVHAWIITTAIWNSIFPPHDPTHVYNTHGRGKTGSDNWLMRRYDGADRLGLDFYLDPGHPDAADYIAEMYLSVIRNYDVDGVNFDRVRYPDTGGAQTWGYNEVAVARFQAATGRTDKPLPTDPQWSQWRRDQVTSIVRKVYVEAYAIKPHVAISADTITYGMGPQSTVGGWEGTRPFKEQLQDWRAWMREGILDLNVPMNYKREYCTATDRTGPGCFNLDQQRGYTEWNEFAMDNQYARRTTIGSALYLNRIADSITQIRKSMATTAAGNSAIGWVGYSYRTPDCLTNRSCGPFRSGDDSRAELTRALTQPSEYDTIVPPVFAEPAAIPGLPWKDSPTKGHVRGTVTDDRGEAFDQARVDIYTTEDESDPEGTLVVSHLTTGSGWFGAVDLAPGRYKALVDVGRAYGQRVATFSVAAGQVTTVTIEAMRVSDRPSRPVTDVPSFDAEEAEPNPNGER